MFRIWPDDCLCPGCGAAYRPAPDQLGARVDCPACGRPFHLLPPSDEAPTLIGPSPDSDQQSWDLAGRLWLDLRPGLIVAGRFEVIRLLGRGGLGQVYQVRDILDHSVSALKLPLPSSVDRLPPQVFIDEALAWLKPAPHPHLVTCLGVRLILGQPAIFMEYVGGSDLSRLISRPDSPLYQGPTSDHLARLLDIFIQAARGLGYAHRLGLAHLDIKPRNLLAADDGRILLSDYGPLSAGSGQIGSDGQEPPPDRPPAAETRLAATRLMGTYQYFSPEAAAGLPGTGIGADLWALSLTALECFLGHRPWEIGAVAGRALNHYLNDLTPKITIPNSMAEFFRQALNDDRERRHQSAAELEEALLDIHRRELGRPYPRPEAKPELESLERIRMKAECLAELKRARAALTGTERDQMRRRRLAEALDRPLN